MLSFNKLCNKRANFTRLTGVKIDNFKEIVEKVRPDWDKLQKKKKVSGLTPPYYRIRENILLIIQIALLKNCRHTCHPSLKILRSRLLG